tara:strand:- start:366 stop:1058 length:693 start_codon:yes stop_codon:yes gene_type:complete
MGIKDNFDNALRKAITLDPIGYREILKNSNDIEEVKTHKGKKCNEVHPGVLHSKWVNQKPEEEMDEATTSASAGAFMAPLGVDPRFTKKKKKEEFDEATTAGSSGSYETPQMWAKNAKNWRGAAKTQWPGGQFVKIKDKCKKFPYCNQGDINALDLSENKMVKHAIQEVSKKTGKDKNYIKKLVKKEMEEIIRRSIYKSPITSILGPETKMDKPIGKIYSMGSNVGGKYE